MINADAFSSINCQLDNQGHVFRLSKNIAAIQVLASNAGEEPRLGMITQLPAGAELNSCGEGFNERTVRVRWAGGTYFVFLQDLDVPLTMFAAV